ncbi:hypothetical protein TH61_05125 [Rufibacter sp. DG15C]|uniref:BatA domain-containing protein n=1 Tax=Rufibacter sp. DG15C TaxID=1379909 RepID=UPI00078C0AA1|nr:BatA domain-containing protein [Rufibacter sp. DG15C]AMM50683.1 hypothetical protein TH61_05125 [Rufibacter sp. DG15C]
MLQFLHPVWLWAAAGVVVPIAIHLWNKKPPKTVQVGSIRWLQPSQSQKLSSIHLSQVWLLLLRCLMVLLLALLLAQPQWTRPITAQPENHVYLHPALLQKQYLSQITTTVDSLAGKGWQVHTLASGFPKLSLDQETSIASFQSDSTTADTTNAWARLRVLTRSFPSHAKAWIFTTNLVRHHRGAQPALRAGFTWVPVSAPQTEVWLQEAYCTQKNQLRVKVGKSDDQAVIFTEHTVAKPAYGQTISLPQLPAVKFTTHAQADSLTLQGGAQNTISLQKLPLQVLVQVDKARQADVRYLKAALQTALDYREQAYSLTASSSPQPLPSAAPDWVFWLTDEPLASFLARFPEKRLKTLQDAPTSARVQKRKSWLQIPGVPLQVPLHQRTLAEKNLQAQILWQDGYGDPLLTQTHKANQTQYQFYSRFHPTWNTLVDSGHFPEALLRLLFPEDTTWKTLYDTRALPPEVERPKPFSGSFQEIRPKTEEVLDLKLWLVGVLALLLALERWLAGRRKRIAS